MNININQIRIYTEKELTNVVKSRLRKQIETYWNDERDKLSSGKLTTYFKVKKTFNMEQYLMLDKFNLRKALCRFRISAHDLRIESGRYSKNPTDKSDRICTRCGKNEVEDESLSLIDKGIWLVMQEDLNILESRKLCRVMLLKKKEVHCIIAESLLRLYS